MLTVLGMLSQTLRSQSCQMLSSGPGSALLSRCRRLSNLSGCLCGSHGRLGVLSGRLHARRRRFGSLCGRSRRLGSLSGRVLAVAHRTAVELLHDARWWLSMRSLTTLCNHEALQTLSSYHDGSLRARKEHSQVLYCLQNKRPASHKQDRKSRCS